MKKKKLIPIGIVLAFIGVISMLFFMLRTNTAYQSNQLMYQMVAGMRSEYQGGSKFLYGDKGPTYSGADINEYISNAPLYSLDKTVMVIPVYSIYVNPYVISYQQVPCFSEITFMESAKINGKPLVGGFIFDGISTYTFLEDMQVELNGVMKNLTAYSSITISNGNLYSIYNFDTDTVEFGEYATKTLDVLNEDYRVDILNDILYDSKGERNLIHNNPMVLEVL